MTGRRIAASGALILLAGGAAGAVFLAGAATDAVLGGVGIVVATVLGWRAATRPGGPRIVASCLALPALGAVGFAFRQEPRGLVPVVAAAAVSVVAARAALGKGGAPPRRDAGGTRVPAARHGVLVINPKAGGAGRVDLDGEARVRGIEPIVLDEGDDLREVAARAIERGADAVGVAGGDGSQAVVATLAAEHDVAFVCVPGGTRNHLALDLGLEREDIAGALDAFGEATERRIDLAKVGERIFVNNASLGIFAKVVQSEEYRDEKLKTIAKMLPELLEDADEEVDLRVTPPGSGEQAVHLLLVSNNRYELRGLGAIGTRARLDEGRLGVVAVRLEGAADAAKLGAKEVAGNAAEFPGWHEWTAKEVEVRSGRAVEASIDGEAEQLEPPLEFSTLPGALRVRLPMDHPLRSPAAARRRYGRFAVQRLFRIAAGTAG
jgi:diacylglycerol kinase family enzyme